MDLHVLPSLIARNIHRHLHRLAAMGVVLVLVFALLLVGNALLAASTEGFRRVYTAYLTGDYTIAPAGAESFTIFGSEALLVAEFEVAPTIIDAPKVVQQLRSDERVQAVAGIVSSTARVQATDSQGAVAGGAENQVLFGVDFSAYTELFPRLELIAGKLPEPGVAAILVQEERYHELNRATGLDSVIGATVLATAATANSFVIRELEVAGVYRYPVEDALLSQVALIDAPTARALNGYVYGAGVGPEVTERDQDLLDSDLDSLFGASDEQGSDDTELSSGLSSEAVPESEFMFDNPFGDEIQATDLQRGVEGTYNFLLLRSNRSASTVERALTNGGFSLEEYRVRGWRPSAGGVAQLVFVLQILLNLALGFVTLGALSVTTNALVLSVLERGKELGTLRAMGAGSGFVSLLIAGEAAAFVLFASSVGLLVGSGGVVVLNALGIELSNPLISMLFGTRVLQAMLTPQLLLWHVGAGVLVAIAAVLYPLKRVLEISPVRAMAGDSYHA